MKQLLAALNLDAIVGLDFETYYDDDYSLRKMSTTEYIVDERFEAQMVSVQWHNDRKPKVLNPTEFKRFCREVNWMRTGMLAHHTHFDGLILSHHFGVKPAFYFDTLSMARPLMPVQVGGSLKAVCAAFGRQAKKRAGALEDVKGVRKLTPAQFKALAAYAGDDIEDTWFIFHKLLKYTSTEELRLIDLTVKMYAQPSLHIDGEKADGVRVGEIDKKAALLKKSKTEKSVLMSNQQFADLLREYGVEPPIKISKTTGQPTLALARNDLAFKDLLKHPSKKVRTLVEARMASKSTILETRAAKMAKRSVLGAQPVYLNYWGARTGRWSGGDKMNWQNFNRGSDLRLSILAPPRHKLIIADLKQIEARLNAWFGGQLDVLEAFRDGKDVYSLAASKIYGRPIDQKKDPNERFVGKVATLALGYGAGAARFADMLRVGQFGPPVQITDSLARDVVQAWRGANPYIVGMWKRLENTVRSAFMGRQILDHGVLTIRGDGEKGFIYLPGGAALRYDGIEFDGEGMSYISRWKRKHDGEVSIERTRLYGGLLVENVIQALARRVMVEHMLRVKDAIPNVRIATTTHDELLLVVPERGADLAHKRVVKIMSTSPEWAKDLPIGVDSHVSGRYDKK